MKKRFGSNIVNLRKGYIAFTTFLILSAVIFLAGTTLALLSISQLQQSLAGEKGSAAHALAEGCVEDALLSTFKDENYSGGGRTLPEGICTTSVSKVGDNWVLTTTGTLEGSYTRRIRVNIVRGDYIQVLSWKEIE
ncbi:MAG: hypothetical protein BMS9Abin34_313 [Patescibacteria group bacterium]|nr:MAG: hypothetical protein BMS9Abin34_313 [Patescibacteria group bacterium]